MRFADIGGYTCRGFGNFAELRAAGLDDSFEIFQRLLSLFFNTASDDLHRRRIERDASRAEEQVPDLDGLRIRSDCSRRLCAKRDRIVNITTSLYLVKRRMEHDIDTYV